MTGAVPVAQHQRQALWHKYHDRVAINPALDRSLVSYQANKKVALAHWFTYREGFSALLVKHLLQQVHPTPGRLLDPFAGVGTTLFTAAALGWHTHGIEVLPVGVHASRARLAAEQVDTTAFAATVDHLLSLDFAAYACDAYAFQHIPITRGAYPAETERALVGYIAACHQHIADPRIRDLALFAAFCVLEEISFTRKDGQYLRWDARSGRSVGKKPFAKGTIRPFAQAIAQKLTQMLHDLTWNAAFDPIHRTPLPTLPRIEQGSCLEILPHLDDASYEVIFTSPPYCNRYDYTRTYALELVYLGYTHEHVTRLRQAMLSCTVENKEKREHLHAVYAGLGRSDDFVRIEQTVAQQEALQEVLDILAVQRDAGTLNNPHIVRMVRNYFYEMGFVLCELARLLSPGGHIIMVNDNVRYGGEEIPVDLILTDMAESFGLVADTIWALPRGKGNSSQQMGTHGRTELRKGVYVWAKPGAT